MRNFNVLMTCCSMHVKELVDCLKDNEDRVNVKVVLTNSAKDNLPPTGIADAMYVVPSVYDDSYIDTLIDICNKEEIDIIVPTATLELEIMAKNAYRFEELGIKVSVSSLSSLMIANNKISLYSVYEKYMPKEIIANNIHDVDSFLSLYKYKNSSVCCKVSNSCGGKGFAVIDNDKSLDVSIFGKYGERHYISSKALYDIVGRGTRMILQEHIDGLDYSVSLLATNGDVVSIAGYVGYSMCFGAIMHGEIKHNEIAYNIARKIVKELGLDGNIAFDFILKNDGTVKLLEINPRVNASLPFVKAAGCNMLYLRCKQLLGYGIAVFDEIQEGLKMKKFYGTRFYV